MELLQPIINQDKGVKAQIEVPEYMGVKEFFDILQRSLDVGVCQFY
jgi:hypothetical protein